MRSPVFFLWGRLGEFRERDFCFFSCSQCVPMGFSKVFLNSQVVPQDVPNSTWVSSPIICPKFNSHVHKLERLAIKHLFVFCDLGSKEVLLLESAQCSRKKLVLGQSIWSLPKRKNVWAHPWTN
jgi:hypothetical protein